MTQERDYNKPKYDDSAEFTDELEELKSMSEKMVRIVNSPAFKQWLQATDNHFDTDCMWLLRPMQKDATTLHATIEALDAQIQNAS